VSVDGKVGVSGRGRTSGGDDGGVAYTLDGRLHIAKSDKQHCFSL